MINMHMCIFGIACCLSSWFHHVYIYTCIVTIVSVSGVTVLITPNFSSKLVNSLVVYLNKIRKPMIYTDDYV